jgi:excisionase family DNA binding protein
MPSTDNSGLPLAYRVNEACHTLSISRSTLYEEIAAGRLRAVKCGNRTLIPVVAAKAWLESLPAKAA